MAILPSDAGMTLAAELSLQVMLTRAAGREIGLVRLDRAPAAFRYQVARESVVLLAAWGAHETFVAAAVHDHLDLLPSLASAREAFRRQLAARSPAP
ncbi:hypothetical protein D3C83_43550 [compost metagenome]